MTRADLDKQPREVAAMFDGVARRYDLTNTVLSFGLDRGWRRATAAALGITAGDRVLDVAAGTGVSTVEYARAGASAVGCDFSIGMLRAGRRRGVRLVGADALRLPFAAGSFDAVTVSFGLRNMADTGAALREFARVTKPGGRLVVCEFSTPVWGALRVAYLEYLMRALPRVATRISSNADAYVYLAESIRAWPDQPSLAEIIDGAGWAGAEWRNLAGGIVALHRATRT